MPINASVLKVGIIGALAATGNVGEKISNLAGAIATAYFNWITTVVKVSTIDAGLPGSGVGSGFIVGALPATVSAACAAMAAANGLAGQAGISTCTAIGQAIGTHTLLGSVSTTHAGVGVGTGSGFLILGPPTALLGLILSEFAAQGIVGNNNINIAKAVSDGVVQGLSASTVVVIIAGAGSPPASSGAGSGSVV